MWRRSQDGRKWTSGGGKAQKRRYPRYEADIPVSIITSDGRETRRKITQISRAGCLVSPSLPNLSADDVDLSFRLDETLNAISTKGEIIYEIYDKGIGIAFRGMPKSASSVIEEFFSKASHSAL